jgi:hypothetical protein
VSILKRFATQLLGLRWGFETTSREIFMGAAFENAQTFDYGKLPEKTGGPGKLVNLMRCLPAFPRVFKNIVDKQISPR